MNYVAHAGAALTYKSRCCAVHTSSYHGIMWLGCVLLYYNKMLCHGIILVDQEYLDISLPEHLLQQLQSCYSNYRFVTATTVGLLLRLQGCYSDYRVVTATTGLL